MSDLIPGAVVPEAPEMNAAVFDSVFNTFSKGDFFERMGRQAYGEDYPEGVEPFSTITRWTLDTLAEQAHLSPGDRLIDIACGRGGAGLWLAQHTNTTLTGIDWSPVAVAAATQRGRQWLPPDRFDFQIGQLTVTGLPSGSAEAAVCIDAVFFAFDRIAAVREAARLLVPGGRYVFTADEADDDAPRAVPDWRPIIRAGGLEVEARFEIPNWRHQLGRLYDLWLDHLDEARALFGEEAAQGLQQEAQSIGAALPHMTGVLYTARKPWADAKHHLDAPTGTVSNGCT